MDKYKVIDLFAGAGGLSLGFMQTQKYNIKVAFENSPCMQQTYRLNHPGVDVQGDVCSADFFEIKKKYNGIDIVIGGPPCQGFSNANRQKNHAINQNNMLVKQYLRAILELQPKAFVMENVSMLRSEVHRFYMEKNDVEQIERCHIPAKTTYLQLLDEKYMFEGALDIVKDINMIETYLWPKEDYSELNVIYKVSRNPAKMEAALKKHKQKLLRLAKKHFADNRANIISIEAKKSFSALLDYYSEKITIDEIKDKIEPTIMTQRMLSSAKEIFDNNILVDSYLEQDGIVAVIRSFAVLDYLKGILSAPENDYVIESGVLCAAEYGAPQKRMRFIITGIKRSISEKIALPNGRFDKDEYRTVRDAIGDLEDVDPVYDLADDVQGIKLQKKEKLGELATLLRDSDCLRNHIITRTTETAMARFKAIQQGKNFHSLDESLITNTYTDPARTQNTIYLRLNYDEPCGTVVNVRKSMWIHPTKDRAISVREAARLQTFPDSFVFCGTKDKQYQQVGNAVPPIMAKAIAKKLAQTLTRTLQKAESDNG